MMAGHTLLKVIAGFAWAMPTSERPRGERELIWRAQRRAGLNRFFVVSVAVKTSKFDTPVAVVVAC